MSPREKPIRTRVATSTLGSVDWKRRRRAAVIAGKVGTLAVAVVALFLVAGLLRFVSTPNGTWLGELIGLVLIMGSIVSGLLMLIRKLSRRAPPRFTARRVALGLTGFALGVALLVDGPFLVRWELSEDAFEEAVAQTPRPTGTDWEPLDVPARIGSIDVQAAHVLPSGGIVFDTGMALFEDAGIAWFPDGPPPILSDGFGGHEDPQFTQFSGPWYLWTASW